MKDFELMLLNMWKENNIKYIYKYKSRIKSFREPLTNIELFYDITLNMFQDVEDIANHNNSATEDFTKDIEYLIKART